MATIPELLDTGMSQNPADPNVYRRYRPSQILNQDFRPEFDRVSGQLPNLEQTFMDRLNSGPDFEAYRSELDAFGGSLMDTLFGPGGQVEQATRQALGQSVASGFGPTSGGFDKARLNILGGARDAFGGAIAGQAVNIAQLAGQQHMGELGALGGFQQFQAGRADDLRESLFGGEMSIRQMEMDRETMELNRRMVEAGLAQQGGGGLSIGGALEGALGGAAAGSFIPGIGSLAGGIIGGIGGLFG
jgi:hypothetical protein